MEESKTSGQLASTAADFQAAAEAYYSIAVGKVKDVRYVAGHVSIIRLARLTGSSGLSRGHKHRCYRHWVHIYVCSQLVFRLPFVVAVLLYKCQVIKLSSLFKVCVRIITVSCSQVSLKQ